MQTQIRKFFNADDMSFGGLFDDEVLSSAVEKNESFGGSQNPDFYSPSNKDEKAVNKIYKATLRLVPNVKDTARSKIHKFVYYFDNGTDKFYVDCPSNIDKKSKNIITEAYFATWKHDSATLREISKNFKRKPYYWCLAVINEDVQHPELVGTVKIFRFGNQIDDLIIKQNMESPGKTKVNVLNPFTGKDLYLDIRTKKYDNDQTMTTYEESYFGENRTTIRIDGHNIEAKQENNQMVHEFLEKNSPDLLQCEAKAWDEETERKVIETVRDLLAIEPALFNQIYTKVYGKPYFKEGGAAKAATTAPNNSAGATQSGAPKQEETPVDANAKQKEMNEKLATKTPAAETKAPPAGEADADDDGEAFKFDFEELPEG